MDFTEWNEIDTNKPSTWPEDGQLVEYVFIPTGSNSVWEGVFNLGEWNDHPHGSFCSEGGFCDWHDAPYWKPRDGES
jgi:hypothetical protein